jgi:two-component system LytT family response regulator
MIRVATVDDEPLARERVAALVRETPGLELVGEARNGLEALDLITTLAPDVVFIDIEMPELSGFGVVAALEGERVPEVVFITAYERYALRAFEVGALDYLQKPVSRSRFQAAVERVRRRLGQTSAAQARALVTEASHAERVRGFRTRFVVSRGGAHAFVRVEDVDWIDVADNYLQLHADGRVHLYRGTLKDAEDELDPARFARIHRSTMVALDRVISVRTHASGVYVVELRGGVRLRSGRQYAERVRALLRQRSP